jgi:DNA-binding transcriptional ArsR family regulator
MFRSWPKRCGSFSCYDLGMAAGVDMAAVAALVGDPARANMLAAMLDGRAHTATELAQRAAIAAPTASGHLAKLSRAKLIGVVAQGRHRYYRLASAEIGRMLEGIMVVAGELAPTIPRATPRVDPALRRARTCYDHIAGELGVEIADGLVQLGVVDLTVDGAAVTETGRAALQAAGIQLDGPRRNKRVYCRPCLDWSERRPHIAGALGAALLERALAIGLVRRRKGSRALDVSGGHDMDALHRLGFDGRPVGPPLVLTPDSATP